MTDDELRSELRRLRHAARLSQRELATRVGYGRDYVSKIEAGERLPSAGLASALDRALSADGRLVELRARAWRQRQADRAGVPAEVDGRAVPPEDGGGDTDRRQVLALGGAALAAQISDRIARADPTPLTVRELAADVDALAVDYPVTPYADLAPRIERGWRDVETLLDSRVSSRVRARLTLLAGQYAYYLGQLAFATGQDRASGVYLALAGQHAAEADDLALAGSVATIDSALSYYSGDFARSAEVAAGAGRRADPFVRPKLAACEARAAARAGRPEQARAALGRMREAVWTGGARPGPEMVDEEAAYAYAAVVGGYLGDGEQAEVDARRSLALLDRKPGQYVQAGGTYAALSRAYLHRAHPEPDRAVDAADQALAVLHGQPSRTVRQSVAELHRELFRRWPELPVVADLADRLGGLAAVGQAVS